MATIKIKDGDEYMAKLSKMSIRVKDYVIGQGIYAGAGVIADAIRANINGLPTDDRFVFGGEKKVGISVDQKKGLSKSLGVSEMRNFRGFYNVKVGFKGFNNVKTKRWPNGQPNILIAASTERGTSFMWGNPFIKRAVAAAKREAVEKMKNAADQGIEKIMKG